MNKIPIAVKNAEIIRSILHLLGNSYPGVTFAFDQNEGVITMNRSDERATLLPDSFDIQREISRLVNRRERLIESAESITVDSYQAKKISKDLKETISEILTYEQNGIAWIGEGVFEIGALLDRIFLNFAIELGASECQVPSLISISDLKRCGYLKGENQNISYLFHKSNKSENGFHDDCTCLSPAVCLTAYPALRGKRFGSSKVLTTKGNAFRREGRSVSQAKDPLTRLWEFQVREIIFFGDQSFHDQIQKKYFAFVGELGRRLNISFEIKSATDLFFQVDNLDLSVHQLLTKSKYEFTYLGDVGQQLALSSFNSHKDKFVSEFNIQGYSADFQSFCIAFGMQRWIQALSSAYGKTSDLINTLKELSNERQCFSKN